MKKLFRFASWGMFLLGCALIASAQTDAGSTNKLTNSKGTVADERTNSAAPTTLNAVGEEFVIGNGDVLAINVWKEAEISRTVPVRSDGRITLPLIGEIEARGHTAKQVEAEVSTRLKDFVSDPEVTVIVQEVRSQNFNILGLVQHPGTFPLTHSITVLDALALAGGFRDFAKTKSIYVLRQKPDGTWTRLPFNYKEAIKGASPAQNLRLETGDTLVVP
jgi:polysaccharide export outer membrane protein